YHNGMLHEVAHIYSRYIFYDVTSVNTILVLLKLLHQIVLLKDKIHSYYNILFMVSKRCDLYYSIIYFKDTF
ncbi:hypothetical protein LOTGIDRAFT_110235, partial [Lottia gigantea]